MDISALMMDEPAHEVPDGREPRRVLVIETDGRHHRRLETALPRGFSAECVMHWIKEGDDDTAAGFAAGSHDLAIILDGGTGERGLEAIRRARTVDGMLPMILVTHAATPTVPTTPSNALIFTS